MSSSPAPRRALLHVLDLRRAPSRVPILAQLALEEALLRADGRNWLVLNTGGGGGAPARWPATQAAAVRWPMA